MAPEPVEGPVEVRPFRLVGSDRSVIPGLTGNLLSYRAKRVYLREQKRPLVLTKEVWMCVGEQNGGLVLTEVGDCRRKGR